ncbi:MAG TPA: putative HNHc nuclease [Clostridiaceae bacterium]
MKNFSQPVQVLSIKEIKGKAFLTVGLDITKEELLKYSTNKGIHGEITFDDGRKINAEQRKKLYATFKDIADWNGDVPEYIKQLFKYNFCMESGLEDFSLSNCTLEVARAFIDFVIEFVIMNSIPLTDLALNRTTEISTYLFYCLKHSKCSICGQEAIIYTLDDKSKISLCTLHHDIAKEKGLEFFKNTYKVYGIEYVKL